MSICGCSVLLIKTACANWIPVLHRRYGFRLILFSGLFKRIYDVKSACYSGWANMLWNGK